MDFVGHFLPFSVAWSFVSTALIISYLISTIPMYKLAIKAGVSNPWLAFIPVLQFVLFLHMIDRSAFYVLVLLIPVIGVFVWMFFEFQFLTSFDVDPILAILGIVLRPAYFIIIIYLAFSENVTYHGYHSYS